MWIGYMQNTTYTTVYMTLASGILVFTGVLEPIPCGYQDQLHCLVGRLHIQPICAQCQGQLEEHLLATYTLMRSLYSSIHQISKAMKLIYTTFSVQRPTHMKPKDILCPQLIPFSVILKLSSNPLKLSHKTKQSKLHLENTHSIHQWTVFQI